MKRKLFSLAIICAALFTGCGDTSYIDSENVEQNSIMQCYSVVYDAQIQRLSCEAVYYIDNQSGDLVRLTGSSSVTCEKEAMTFEKGHYFLGKDCPNDPDKVSFSYVNNDGKEYKNSFKFKPIDTKSEDIALTLGVDNTISFKGKKANEYDRFFLVIKNEGHENVEIEAMEASGNELIFAAEDLSVLAKGTYVAQFLRRCEGTDVKAAERGGFWNAEYLSVLKKVTIK